MGVIKFILSGEFLFAGFLMAGFIKGGFSWLPVDMTVLFLVLSVAVAAKRFLGSPGFIKNTYVAFLTSMPFVLVVVISSFYSPTEWYATDKVLRFLVITCWSFWGAFFLLKSENSIKRFLKSLVAISTVVVLVAFQDVLFNLGQGTYNGTIFILDTDYLALGRTVGLGIVVLIGMSWFSSQKTKATTGLLIIFSFLILVMSGGRMPLLAVGISVVALMIFSMRLSLSQQKIYLNSGSVKILKFVALAAVALIPLSQTAFLDTTLRRVTSLFSGNDESAFARINLYETAWEMFYNNPLFGQGWGSFSLFYFGTDEKVYPHNLFLEVLAEIGLIGLLTFLLMLATSIFLGYRALTIDKSSLSLTVVGAFVFCFFNAMTSGDLTDNKLVFTFMSLLIIAPSILNVASYNRPENDSNEKVSRSA